MPLTKSDTVGTWIKDFRDSKAPQFKGKTDKEKRDMAVAAYLAKKREQKEGAKLDEKGPKIGVDFLKKERERNRAHDAAMGRTPTGRKKPVRTMTSTQRSLAQVQAKEKYVSHAQRKAVWANRADGGKGHPDKKK